MNKMETDFMAKVQELGAELQKRRQTLGLEITFVAEKTKITASYIQAIEEGKFELLPKGFYLKNFIRQYCNFLGASKQWSSYTELFELQTEAEKLLNENTNDVDFDKNLVQKDKYRPINNKPILVMVVLLFICAIISFFSFKNIIFSENSKDINQLNGGTAQLIEQQKAEDAAKQKQAEEEARKLAEIRAEAEENDYTDESATKSDTKQQDALQQPVEETPIKLAANELYIFAPKEKVKIKVSREQTIIFEGDVMPGKGMRFKVEENTPMRVRYENPNKTEVTFGDQEFKPLHPSSEGRSRYYWSDGKVTFTGKR